MSTGGIKELVADVDVVAADIRASAVGTAAIAAGAVTKAKISTDVGKWSGMTFAAGGTTAYATWTATAACTVLDVIVQITAAASANQAFVVQDTAAAAQIIPSTSGTAAKTVRATVATALGSEIPVIELAAGASLEMTGDANSGDIAGKLFVEYITTPS